MGNATVGGLIGAQCCFGPAAVDDLVSEGERAVRTPVQAVGDRPQLAANEQTARAKARAHPATQLEKLPRAVRRRREDSPEHRSEPAWRWDPIVLRPADVDGHQRRPITT